MDAAVEISARHLSKTPLDASNLPPGLEPGARHLSKTRRDASNLRAAGSRCQAPSARDPSELVLT